MRGIIPSIDSTQWVEVGGIPYPEYGDDDEEELECNPEEQDYWFNFDCIPEEYFECYFYWLQ